MADSHRLLLRNGTYYYRRRIPLDLVEAMGKTVIKYSLKTSNLKEAKRRREVADIEWSARFASATNQPVQSNDVNDGTATSISHGGSDLARLVMDYVTQTDARIQHRIAEDPPESEAQRAELIRDAEIDLQILGGRDDPGALESVDGTIRRILSKAGIAGDQVRAASLAELVRRALMELDRRRLAYLTDDCSRTHFDQRFGPSAAEALKGGTTFGEIADQHLGLVAQEATANGRSRKWVDKQTACVALIREIVGQATPIRAVGYDMCVHVRATLARVPANRLKFYGDLPLEEAISCGEAEGRSALSPQTQQAYLAAFKGILDLATKKRLIPGNLAQGLTPLKRDTVSASDKRAPFTSDQLIQCPAPSVWATDLGFL